MRFIEDIQVKQNLFITARERGKIVARREGHNIFVNTGREWLSKLIAYQAFSPDVLEEDHRVRYMGFGIGGTRQLALTTANSAPLSVAYPGSNVQTDIDPTLFALERPVRLKGSSSASTLPGDVWLGQVQAPSDHPTATSVTFRRLFTGPEVSYSPFNTVPLSEIGLFTSGADPALKFNSFIAYDTFDTLSKTTAFEIEAVWTIRFG
jgi:hypothetical protein